MDKGTEAEAHIGSDVVAILNDLRSQLQRIEVTLAASSATMESPRRREIGQRRGYTTQEVASVGFRKLIGLTCTLVYSCASGRSLHKD